MVGKKKKGKGRTKSKAAQETARLKHGVSQNSGVVQSPKSGGLMTKMRGGFQGAVGGGDTESKGSVFHQVVWFAVLAAPVFFFARGF